MADFLILEYKRVDGDKSTGRIVYLSDEAIVKEIPFEAVSFRTMLRTFAEQLHKVPDGISVLWQRTDRPGLNPYGLDCTTVDLFKKDPVAAIESMCPDIQSGSTRVISKQSVVTPSPVLRIGHDCLADAFGEDTYVRRRGDRAECPGCGMWLALQHSDTSTNVSWVTPCRKPSCTFHKYAEHLIPSDISTKWVSFQTAYLLKAKSPRYYLPRIWNRGRLWITWEELNQMYTDYLEEKRNVHV